jgi:cobalt-zinc-cadmium resistance protein CzcA
MILKIIEFSLKNRIPTIVMGVFIILAGTYSWIDIRKEAYPDIADTQVRLIAKYPGRAAEEIEQRVTLPIERVLNAVPKVIIRRSRTINGLVVFQFVFQDGTDDYFARTRLLEKVREADIPDDVQPQLGPLSSPVSEIFRYVIEAEDNYTPMELRTLQDWVIVPKLLAIPGMADVITFGGYVKQYHVITTPDKLVRYKLELDDIITAIKENNLNTGGNILRRGEMGFAVRGIGAIRKKEHIENIVVKKSNGVPIFIKDIGTVEEFPSFPTGILGHTIQEEGFEKVDVDMSIQGMVAIRRWEDAEEMGKKIRAKIDEINELHLPPGVRLRTAYDRNELIGYTLRTISKTLFEGISIVTLILIFFIGSARAALVVATTIPISLLFAFIMMKLTGISVNLLSLGAIDFGIIVDGAVVMVENIMRKYRDSTKEERAIGIVPFTLQASSEVGREIFFSILIIILAYLPIFTFTRIEGRLFSPMAYTLAFAIGGSLLLALTFIPVLMTFIYGKIFEGDDLSNIEWHNPVYHYLTEYYAKVLPDLLKNAKQVVIISFIIVVVISSYGVSKMGSEFLPELDEGGFNVRGYFPVGISLKAASKYMKLIRDTISKNEQVKVVLTQLGRNDDGTDPLGPNRLEVQVTLKDYNQWKEKITKLELLIRMRNDLEEVMPGVRFSFSQPIMDNLSEAVTGTIADLAIFVGGQDLKLSRKYANEILAIIKDIPGASEYGIEQEGETAQLNILIDREAAARYGINVKTIQQMIEAAIGATRISTLYEGPWRFGIVVRFSEESRWTLEAVKNMPVISPSGERIPMDQLAEIGLVDGPTLIFRQQGRRQITVRTNVRGRDQGSFVKEAQEKVGKAIQVPKGYDISWGGQYENLARVSKQLAIVIPLTIFIIFLVLYNLFKDIFNVIVAMSCLPFSLVGGLVALLMRGYYFNVSSGIGFISLFGVATISGVLFVSRVNQIQKENKNFSLEESVEKAAIIQLRPLLMTILLALLGLIPATLATGVGSDVQRPLATVIVGGLTSGLILTATTLPSLFLQVEKLRKTKKVFI